MIIYNFNVFRSVCGPHEANAKLVVYANTILANAIALECLQSIARGSSQIVQSSGPVKDREFTHCNALEIYETPDPTPIEQVFSINAPE